MLLPFCFLGFALGQIDPFAPSPEDRIITPEYPIDSPTTEEENGQIGEITFINNRFVIDHITSFNMVGMYERYDYLRYQFRTTLVSYSYELDIIMKRNNETVVEDINFMTGEDASYFYFSYYLDNIFSVGEYQMILRFRDLNSGTSFEISESFLITDSDLLMSEPFACTVENGEVVDVSLIPVVSVLEDQFNVCYYTINTSDNLVVDIKLTDEEDNIIYTSDNVETELVAPCYCGLCGGEGEKKWYITVNMAEINRINNYNITGTYGIYNLDITITDEDAGDRDTNRLVLAVFKLQ